MIPLTSALSLLFCCHSLFVASVRGFSSSIHFSPCFASSLFFQLITVQCQLPIHTHFFDFCLVLLPFSSSFPYITSSIHDSVTPPFTLYPPPSSIHHEIVPDQRSHRPWQHLQRSALLSDRDSLPIHLLRYPRHESLIDAGRRLPGPTAVAPRASTGKLRIRTRRRKTTLGDRTGVVEVEDFRVRSVPKR